MRSAALTVLFLLSGCSKQPGLNYKHCLRLRIGMTREDVLKAMGPADETIPYVEGKSMPNSLGRTSYEWVTPSSMPAPAHVTIEDASGKAESIRCSDVVVTAAVFVEPPAPEVSTTVVYGVQPGPPATTPGPRRGPREVSPSSARSSGRPLTE